MSQSPRPPAHVPTLTEVIDLSVEGVGVGQTVSAPVVTSGFPNARPTWAPISNLVVGAAIDTPLAAAPMPPVPASVPARADITEAQIAQRVLNDVQKQIDGLLDFRLREALGPILARHSEALVRDLREELGRTMRDVVARSVAQEMAKLRQR
jgi:predicted component of type VI protein secretion system